MDKNFEIGNFIAACREEKKLTQAKLGELLGVTNKSVSKWENGKGLPDTKIMPSLCELLGITLGELLNGKRDPVSSSPVLDDLSRLIHVSKYYRDDSRVNIGLKDVNLTLNLGEVVAVTGVSGSGKTTLLKTIGGMDSFEQGEIYLESQGISRYDENDYEAYRKKYISYIFQEYGILEKYSLIDNLILVRLMMGDSYALAKEKSESMLKKISLYPFRGKKANKLSGGQKQKLAVARALIKDTPIILGDEITASLDSKQGKEILKLLFSNSANKLVVLVTHHFEELEEYCTRKIVLVGGEVMSDEVLRPVEKKPLVLEEEKKKSSALLSFELFRKIVKNNIGRSLLLTFLIAIPLSALLAGNCGLDYAYFATEGSYISHVYKNNEMLAIDSSGLSQAKVDQILEIDGVKSVLIGNQTYFADQNGAPKGYVVAKPDLPIDMAIIPSNIEGTFNLDVSYYYAKTQGNGNQGRVISADFNTKTNTDPKDKNVYIPMLAYRLLQSLCADLSDYSKVPTLHYIDGYADTFEKIDVDFSSESSAITLQVSDSDLAQIDHLSFLGVADAPFIAASSFYTSGSISVGRSFILDHVESETYGTNLLLLVDEKMKAPIKNAFEKMGIRSVSSEDEVSNYQTRTTLFFSESFMVLGSIVGFVLLLLVSRKLIFVVMKGGGGEMDLLRKLGFRQREVSSANVIILVIPMAFFLLANCAIPFFYHFTSYDFLFLGFVEIGLYAYFTLTYITKKFSAMNGGKAND